MSKIKDFSVRGVSAGAAIGIAGFAYLAVGGVFGALLFSFGLVSIYVLQLKLFTGMAGNETLDAGGLGRLLAVLALNFLGVCIFIMCGFCHCIADAFYLSLLPLSFVKAHFLPLLAYYSCIVAGNFIGCNLRRLLAL